MFRKLNEEPSWNTLEEAAVRLAFFKSELNMLHPFREGNGRTIRIFIYRYALSRGIEWDYEMVQSVVNTELLRRQVFLETIHYTD